MSPAGYTSLSWKDSDDSGDNCHHPLSPSLSTTDPTCSLFLLLFQVKTTAACICVPTAMVPHCLKAKTKDAWQAMHVGLDSCSPLQPHFLLLPCYWLYCSLQVSMRLRALLFSTCSLCLATSVPVPALNFPDPASWLNPAHSSIS